MEKYIVDTNVVVKLFVDQERREHSLKIFQQARHGQIKLLAPTLIRYEFPNALIKAGLSTESIQNSLGMFEKQIKGKVITTIPPTLKRSQKVIQLAFTDTRGKGYISSYDATFHELALAKNAIFITDDKKHFNKTKDAFGSIMLLEDF